MGQACCCAERTDAEVKARAARERPDALPPLGDKHRGEKHSKPGDDCERFDLAFETDDYAEFVSLLKSDQKITKLEERMHPWAQDPTTVGALAATQLAILASSTEKAGVKDTIREAGAIPPLVAFLSSREDDRVQAAVVALSFLTVENSANCMAIYKAGGFAPLVPHLRSPIEGMRAATASTLRNVYSQSCECRNAFVRMGGVQPLVELLDCHSVGADGESNWDTQFETLPNLEDLVVVDGEAVPELLEAVKRAGAEARVRALCDCEDKEVAELAQAMIKRVEASERTPVPQ
ncbi:unnamed protein product [Vitrella brassicaformis CCMP3155]|uniref:Nucleotide exchange factor Fes1 domain-containing protein n=1 Tax=Vitrella brassicaformis (strain CCMP3155) TaxID=1169540 RepID=A0A0G4ER11_VITBC|nr:unnamed protein product [Vitrella brassicaformis CCMP3155]|eukprot:CEM00006.1 unnamed protein product [Vitrella brassicaformis CCMP3155]